MRRTLAVIVGVLLLLGFTGRLPRHALAVPKDFAITALNCAPAAGTPGSVTIQNQNLVTPAPTAATLGTLTLSIVPASGGTPVQFQISTQINAPDPAGTDTVASGGSVILQVGTGATQIPVGPIAPGNPAPGQIAITTQDLLQSASRVDLLSGVGAGATLISTKLCGVQTSGNVLFVSPNGFDFIDAAGTIPNTQCGPDLPTGTLPSTLNQGPCFTIQNAISNARDGDNIFVEFGFYEVCQPIVVNKLVAITTRETALSGVPLTASLLSRSSLGVFSSAPASGTGTPAPTPFLVTSASVSLAVLHSFSGGPVFVVSAQGYPALDSPANLPNTINANEPAGNGNQFASRYQAHIDGFEIGGASNPGAAAIELENDSNTVVSNNVIGGDAFVNGTYTGQPCTSPRLPTPPPPAGPPPPTTKIVTESMDNAAGIIVGNSDHPDIYNNAILGGANFQFSPALAVGQVLTGFGIVSTECLGQGTDASDGIYITFNLIARNVNAGVWICSDGGGGHLITTSTVRNNGRGIVLRAVSNTLVDTNTVSDNYQDAVVIYDAATNNTVQKNVIESSHTPGAAGLRLGGFGAGLSPLQTSVYNNTIMRNDTDVVLTGARNTSLQYNVITAEVGRTAMLLQVGSQGATQFTQPNGTTLRLNQVVSNGQCDAINGCAIRLDQNVTSDVDAAQNNFGLPSGVDPNTVFWHKPNDPSLGFIVHDLSNLQPAPLAAATAIGAPGAPSLGAVGAAASTSAVASTGAAGAPAGAGSIATIAPAAATVAPATTPAPAVATTTPAAGANTQGGATGTSPQLTTGNPAGSTSYTAGCSFVSVAASAGASISAANFLNQFQPVGNIFAAYLYNNQTQQYQGLYFSDPTIPVQVATLVPGNVVSICVTGTVQGPP